MLRSATACVALVLAALAAPAQDARILEPGFDTVSGTHLDGDTPSVFAIRLFEGAPISLDVLAPRGSGLEPVVRLLGTDRRADPYAEFRTRRGRASLRRFVPKAPGVHWIEIDGAPGTGGRWTLRSRVRLPRRIEGGDAFDGTGGTVEWTLPSPGPVAVDVIVKGAPRATGAPAFVALRDPAGAEVEGASPEGMRGGFALRGVALREAGPHRLLLAPGTGAVSGGFDVRVAFRLLPQPRRSLEEEEAVAAPDVTGIFPADARVTEVVPTTLFADFVRPGATLEFRRGGELTRIPAHELAIVPGAVNVILDFAAWVPGSYDVTLRNADGGAGTLAGGFTVVPAE
jgi:hypothetical protein